MGETTAEEIAIHNALLSLFCWVNTVDNTPPAETRIFVNALKAIAECTRRAVEAEKDLIVDRVINVGNRHRIKRSVLMEIYAAICQTPGEGEDGS